LGLTVENQKHGQQKKYFLVHRGTSYPIELGLSLRLAARRLVLLLAPEPTDMIGDDARH
jgi:hypothetical protein